MSEVREIEGGWLSITMTSGHTSWAYHPKGVSVTEWGHAEGGTELWSILNQIKHHGWPKVIVMVDVEFERYHLIDVDEGSNSLHVSVAGQGSRLLVTELADGKVRLEVI
jgi:hypothetical protein